ncbi:MAG: hypothetical protein ACRDXX_04970 [Stackebrandtia sp.]
MTATPTPDEWAEPYRDAVVEDAVRMRLRTLSESGYPDLPSAVAERLDRALIELPDLTAPDTAPLAAPRAPTPWWKRRFALTAAAGIAVLGLAAGGGVLAMQPGDDESPATALDEADSNDGRKGADSPSQPLTDGEAQEDDGGDSAPEDELGAEGDEETLDYSVSYSGYDYVPEDMQSATQQESTGSAENVADSLRRLADDPTARDFCVAWVQDVHGGMVSVTDFGYFEGQPAMVAVVDRTDGSAVVAAVGADCGLDGVDELYSQEI